MEGQQKHMESGGADKPAEARHWSSVFERMQGLQACHRTVEASGQRMPKRGIGIHSNSSVHGWMRSPPRHLRSTSRAADNKQAGQETGCRQLSSLAHLFIKFIQKLDLNPPSTWRALERGPPRVKILLIFLVFG